MKINETKLQHWIEQHLPRTGQRPFLGGAYALYLTGKVDTPYARGLEYDVPALLREAQLASKRDW